MHTGSKLIAALLLAPTLTGAARGTPVFSLPVASEKAKWKGR